MNRVRKLVHADELHRQGIKGRGVTAVVMDSGICAHPDYIDRVIYFKDFVGKRESVYDDASHGSHVTGILGGNGSMSSGKYCGIAPECDLIHLKVLDRNGVGKMKDTIEALNWVLRNRVKFNIRVLNFSVGSAVDASEEGTILIEYIEKVWDAGIVVIVAAGNMGPEEGSVTVPGTSRKVITVGFYDEAARSSARSRLFFSGRGPTFSCICKPEITAPGAQIVSCSNLRQPGRYYSQKTGTSMATPVVSGAVCLLLSKKPWLSNVEVKMKLKSAADDLGLSRNRQGWGRLNLAKLLS